MASGEPEDLRRVREEAQRARQEAQRLREEARNLAHRLRHQQQEERHRQRDERRAEHSWKSHVNVQFDGSEAAGTADGPRVEQQLDLEGVRTIDLDQTAGKVVVRPCREDEVPSIITSGNKTPPRMEITRDGERLTLQVKLSAGWLFRRRSGATTFLLLRPGFSMLKVNVGAGEIEIREIECETLDLETGAGQIKTYATSGKLEASTGAGHISIAAHRGLARCDIGTGDLTMDIARVDPGEYRGNVGMGRVELRLPPDQQVSLRVSSGIGKSRIEYPSAPEGAPTSAKVETGIGEASVKVRRAGDAVPEPPPAQPGGRAQREGRAEATRRRRESEEWRVLQMLEQGKITSQEAADLIAALQGMAAPRESDSPEDDAFQPQ